MMNDIYNIIKGNPAGHLIRPLPSRAVKIYKLDERAIIPEEMGTDEAGYDICCLEDFTISPGEQVMVRTGLVIQPPPGYHSEVLSRSGMAKKYGIRLANCVGLIDRSYAGETDELKVLLHRELNGQETVYFSSGDRIAQLVFRQTVRFFFEEVDEAPATINRRGGFGSTGV